MKGEQKKKEGVDLCVEDVVHVGEAGSILSGHPPSSPHVWVVVQRCLQPGGDVALKWPAHEHVRVWGKVHVHVWIQG